MCTRCSRRFVVGGLASLAGAAAVARRVRAKGSNHRFSCSYARYSDSADGSLKTMSTSGDARLDRALISELREMVKIIPVNPGFQYVVDDPPNAFADPDSLIPNTNGMVYIGINLLKGELNSRDMGGITVAGICAHECAHIYQFNYELEPKLEDKLNDTDVLIELHADLVAGYYLRRRGWSFERVQAFGESLFGHGDYGFNDAAHHGTPAQRVSAMRAGYAYAMRENALAKCAADGVAFVRSLVGREVRPME